MSLLHSSIFELIELEAWEILEQLLASSHWPSSSSTLNQSCSNIMVSTNCDGMTPLHLIASKQNVPQSLIWKFISLNRKPLHIQSKSLSIPLHYACETGSAFTVRTLLECCSYSCRHGSSDSTNGIIDVPYFSSESSVRLSTQSLDINERSPLERAWLAYLTSTNKYEDYDDDDNENSSSTQSKRRKRKCIGRYNGSYVNNNNIRYKYYSNDLAELWTKTELILYASNKLNLIGFDQRYHEDKNWFLLHEIARSGRSCWCPNIVLWFGIHVLGLHYQLSTYDSNGDLPLHICAKSPVHKILYIPRTNKHCPMMNMSVMEILMDSFPDASWKRSKKEKMIPLHLAILSGKKEKDGIGELLKVNPDGVNELEKNTMLYPFHLSACGNFNFAAFTRPSSSSSSSQRSKGCLELTFQLLRRNPSLLLTKQAYNGRGECEGFLHGDYIDEENNNVDSREKKRHCI